MTRTALIIAGLMAILRLAQPLAGSHTHSTGEMHVNGVTIAYESYGRAGGPAILLIASSGMQLTDWPHEFCETLADRGYRVIVYDNRDSGLSTKFSDSAMPDFAAVVAAAAAGGSARCKMKLVQWEYLR